MTSLINYSKLAAGVCAAAVLAAPAAAQPSKSVSTSARLQAHAVADGRTAARLAHRNSKRARALVKRSLKRLNKAYAITLKATASSDRTAAGFEADAKAVMSFSSAASSEVDALLSVIDRGSKSVDRVATPALNRTVTMQGKVALSLAANTEGLDASTTASAGTALDLLATQQSGVTAGLVQQASARGQSRQVKTAVRKAISRSTKTEAALNAQLADLAKPGDDSGDSQGGDDSPSADDSPDADADAGAGAGAGERRYQLGHGRQRRRRPGHRERCVTAS